MVENHKMIVENSGLLTVAALRHLDFTGKKVVSILSRAATWTLSPCLPSFNTASSSATASSRSACSCPTAPASLSTLPRSSPRAKGNVVRLDHNQFVTTNRNAAVELRVTIEAFGTAHKQQIVEALEAKGFRPRLIQAHL